MIYLKPISYIIVLFPSISRWADFIIRGTVSLSHSAVQNVRCSVNRLRVSQTLLEQKDCMLSSDVEGRWTLFILHRIIHEPMADIRANFLWGLMMKGITVGTGAPVNRVPASSFLSPLSYPFRNMYSVSWETLESLLFQFLFYQLWGWSLSLFLPHLPNCLTREW